MLMYPARQFEVVSSFTSGKQLKTIHLKEIQPPFSLIHIPTTSLSKSEQIKRPLSPNPNSKPSSTETYTNKPLQQFIVECEPYSKVSLYKQNLTDEDMEIVVHEAIIKKQCQNLELKYNQITSVGVSIIAKALNNNTTLEILYLGDNRLCDAGIQSLAKTLSLNNSKVYFLALQSTGITDEGAKHLAEMLKINTTLQYLMLGWNEISDQGVQHLANALTHHNNTLLSLRVDNNKLVSDVSADCLIEMLKHNQTLERLDIEKCHTYLRKEKKNCDKLYNQRRSSNLLCD